MLQLQLSKDQKKLVEALKSQQEEVRELQRLLGEQQGTLVLQQREILEQQRSMFEQLEEVRRLRLMTDGWKNIESYWQMTKGTRAQNIHVMNEKHLFSFKD